MSRRPKPSADIDEDVIWLGTGSASPLTDAKLRNKVVAKNPVGFIWPKTAPPKAPRKSAKKRPSAGRRKR